MVDLLETTSMMTVVIMLKEDLAMILRTTMSILPIDIFETMILREEDKSHPKGTTVGLLHNMTVIEISLFSTI